MDFGDSAPAPAVAAEEAGETSRAAAAASASACFCAARRRRPPRPLDPRARKGLDRGDWGGRSLLLALVVPAAAAAVARLSPSAAAVGSTVWTCSLGVVDPPKCVCFRILVLPLVLPVVVLGDRGTLGVSLPWPRGDGGRRCDICTSRYRGSDVKA